MGLLPPELKATAGREIPGMPDRKAACRRQIRMRQTPLTPSEVGEIDGLDLDSILVDGPKNVLHDVGHARISMKKRILVLGAGFGGLELSTLLSEAFGDQI